ncbi:MAG: hypothetical protein F4148_10025 [Caldilineaceae bacterium SB0675_bin_29]|uniref:Polymerase nucleotidyl transferase domain-containing protein n=1 Tax=Caldilineaceae bacterium SB0675_bin_29 TaxID=2605266 RepID=A0A6B1G7J1_9CHLR|nr:hypothetical protein [Caldilineaceae bacterium SB0675_bin_29]
MELPAELPSLLEEWKTAETVAFALLGSYARGDAGPHSDVDVVRFVDDDKHGEDARSFLVGDTKAARERDDYIPLSGSSRPCLVVRSTVTPSQVESWFTEPGQAVNIIIGLRDGRALWDPNGLFSAIQQRAWEFKWTRTHQKKADQMVGKELVGWIEEAHKGLEGLRRSDDGRLLNARFGLSWGLAWVMRLHRGVFATSDNTFFNDVVSIVGPETRWAKLLHQAFGIAAGAEGDSISLREEVTSGLLLYCETFSLLKESLPQEDFLLIEATVRRIRREMATLVVAADGSPRGPKT